MNKTLQKTLAEFDKLTVFKLFEDRGSDAEFVNKKDAKAILIQAIKDAVEEERKKTLDWMNHQKTLACDKQQWYKISDFEYFINQPRKD